MEVTKEEKVLNVSDVTGLPSLTAMEENSSDSLLSQGSTLNAIDITNVSTPLSGVQSPVGDLAGSVERLNLDKANQVAKEEKKKKKKPTSWERKRRRAARDAEAAGLGTSAPGQSSQFSAGAAPFKPNPGDREKRKRSPDLAATDSPKQETSGTGNSDKKKRDSGTTPEDVRAKRQKPSYAKVSVPGTRVALVPENYPTEKFGGEEDLVFVRALFTKAIYSIPESDGFMPRFKDNYLSRGAVVIVCGNDASMGWVYHITPSLSEKEERKFKAVSLDDLLEYKKVIAWIPGLTDDNDAIFKMLERHNPGLKTNGWRVFERKVEGRKGVRLVLTMDTGSISALEKLGMRPAIGLGEATFTVATPRVHPDASEENLQPEMRPSIGLGEATSTVPTPRVHLDASEETPPEGAQ